MKDQMKEENKLFSQNFVFLHCFMLFDMLGSY